MKSLKKQVSGKSSALMFEETKDDVPICLALACVDPVAGKAERMKSHIKQCKNITDDQRTLALLSAAKVAPRLPSHTQKGRLEVHGSLRRLQALTERVFRYKHVPNANETEIY